MDPKDEAEKAILDLSEGDRMPQPMSPECMEQAEPGTPVSTGKKMKSNSEKNRKREKNSIKEKKKKKNKKKRKRNSRESRSRSNNSPVPIDRLSSLPDPILDHIISFLPPSDATNTRILSKSWHRFSIQSSNIAFFHHLNPSNTTTFRSSSYEKDYGKSYFVACIRKLLRACDHDRHLNSLRIHAPSLCVLYKNLKSWVRYASSHYIHHLDLHLYGCLYYLYLPFSILGTVLRACPCLQTLKLNISNTYIKLPEFNQYNFSHLRVLHLHKIFFSTRSMTILLSASSCPSLEELNLVRCYCISSVDDNLLYISSSSLRRLHLKLYENRCHDWHNLCVMCPKLELFDLTASYPLMLFQGDMPSLAKAVISLEYRPTRKFVLHVQFVGQLLQAARNAAELSFLTICFQSKEGYFCRQPEWNLPISHSVTNLHMDACFHSYNIEALIQLLWHIPNLSCLRVSLKILCFCNIRSCWKPRKFPPGFLDNLTSVIFDDSVLDSIDERKFEIMGQNVMFKDDLVLVQSSSTFVRGFVKCLSMNVSTWEQIEKKYFKYLKYEEEK